MLSRSRIHSERPRCRRVSRWWTAVDSDLEPAQTQQRRPCSCLSLTPAGCGVHSKREREPDGTRMCGSRRGCHEHWRQQRRQYRQWRLGTSLRCLHPRGRRFSRVWWHAQRLYAVGERAVVFTACHGHAHFRRVDQCRWGGGELGLGWDAIEPAPEAHHPPNSTRPQ